MYFQYILLSHPTVYPSPSPSFQEKERPSFRGWPRVNAFESAAAKEEEEKEEDPRNECGREEPHRFSKVWIGWRAMRGGHHCSGGTISSYKDKVSENQFPSFWIIIVYVCLCLSVGMLVFMYAHMYVCFCLYASADLGMHCMQCIDLHLYLVWMHTDMYVCIHVCSLW